MTIRACPLLPLFPRNGKPSKAQLLKTSCLTLSRARLLSHQKRDSQETLITLRSTCRPRSWIQSCQPRLPSHLRAKCTTKKILGTFPKQRGNNGNISRRFPSTATFQTGDRKEDPRRFHLRAEVRSREEGHPLRLPSSSLVCAKGHLRLIFLTRDTGTL